MEKSQFLERARIAAISATIPVSESTHSGGLVPEMIEIDLVSHFVSAATAAGAEVHRGDPHAVVDELVSRYSIETFLSWDVDQINGLESLPATIPRLDATVPPSVEGRLDRNAELTAAGLGITGADGAFAETGTIVVRSGVGRPRMASLVPLVHVAVLSTELIARSLSHWMADQAATLDATNVVFITGPSKTGDIESIITTGVHGPRHLHVVLC